VRAACPSKSQLVDATRAIAFRQTAAPSDAQRDAVRVTRITTAGSTVIARVITTGAAGSHAELQLRAVCARVR
jgi:hypothetical protein